MNTTRTNVLRCAAIAIALVVGTTGCADATAGAEESTATAVDLEGHTNYPLTITNCGEEITFAAAPQRVALLESAPVTILQGLDALDSVTLRAGAFPPEYYNAETNAAIDKIPSLGDNLDTSGHLQISQEVVIAEQPELVLGLPDGITREGLAASGITALIHPIYCPTDVPPTTFDTLYDQIITYGQIFDKNPEAEELVNQLKDTVTGVEASVAGAPERTAAMLFPTTGGGTGYAYGSTSMADPQLTAAGFTNVFGDVTERVFEVSLEELLDRDPDVLVLLYIDGDASSVEAAVTGLPGASELTAVKSGNVFVQRFNFTEPPTPLSVIGLQRIVERFGTGT